MSHGRAADQWRVVIFSVYASIVNDLERVIKDRGDRLVALFTAPGPRTRLTDDYQSMAALARPGLDVVVSNQPSRWATLLGAYRPDLLICVGYNWKLPVEVLMMPRLGTINLHAALLPKYRGPNSFGWALRNAEPEIGWTVHYMTEEIDQGPILAQRSISMTDEDDIDSLLEPYLALIPPIFADAFQRIANGDPGDAQDHARASQAPRFDPEWRMIDWHNPARDIHLQVRSWWGNRGESRGAIADIDGVRTRVIKTKLLALNGEVPFAPGTVLERHGETMLVQCGDHPLQILKFDSEPSS